MSKLRKSAKGRECQIRIPGVCNGNPETVVLAHLNGGGMGRKQPDLFGAFACSACHAAVDGRDNYALSTYGATELRMAHTEAVIRTQQLWLDEGLVEIK